MKYLVDSDFLFGLQVIHDPHHLKSAKIFRSLSKDGSELVILNLVVQEIATVLSRKDSQASAIEFLNKLSKLPIDVMFVGEEDEEEIWGIFKKQTKNKISFIDCANLYIAQRYEFDGILSFDEFYPKSVRITS